MKKLSVLAVLAASVLLFVSCGLFVAPVAYTRFDSQTSQYVYYSSDVYGVTEGQIEVYKDAEEFNAQFGIPDLEFHFGKCMGADDVDGTRYILVSLRRGFESDFTVYVLNEVYSSGKHFYLNGTALVPDRIDPYDTITAYTFSKVPFKRTNPDGMLHTDIVNVLEYK